MYDEHCFLTGLRQWSNRVPLAYKIIVVNALFWTLVTSHRLVYYTNSSGSCWSQEGAYMVFDTYLDVSLSVVGSPLVVIVLACLLWHNVRSVTRRRAARINVAPTTLSANLLHNQQVDLPLTLMLFLQSILAIINYVPFGIYILYYMFTDGWIKSPLRVAWEQLVISLIRLSSYLFAAGSFYVSIISNHSFRKQFLSSFQIRRAIHPASLASTSNRSDTRTVNQQF
jgi:hypothetical protein